MKTVARRGEMHEAHPDGFSGHTKLHKILVKQMVEIG